MPLRVHSLKPFVHCVLVCLYITMMAVGLIGDLCGTNYVYLVCLHITMIAFEFKLSRIASLRGQFMECQDAE